MKTRDDISADLANRIFFCAILLFGLLMMEFLRSDLWFDEIVTVREFAMLKNHRDIFTTYPVANNHMLFSFVEWWWMTILCAVQNKHILLILKDTPAELLRMPSVICAFGTGIFLYVRGRRSLGNATALMLAILLLASPIFLSFAFQLRGYGLSMFLSAMAAIGVIEILRGWRRDGAFLYGLAAGFLPVVIPSNVLVTFSLWLFTAIVLLRRRCDLRNLVFVGAMGVVSCCGLIVYLLIWDKFMKVVKQTGGWESGGQVAGHLALALVVHIGAFAIACCATRLRTPQTERAKADDPVRRQLPLLAVCCLVPVLALAFYRAPFPRVFITYLPPVTLCALWFFRRDNIRKLADFAVILFMIAATNIVWYRTSAHTVQRSLEQGVIRQNLLQQFYSRRSDISDIVEFLVHYEAIPPRARIFIDIHDFPSLTYYWARRDQPLQRLECLNGGVIAPLRMPPNVYRYIPQVIVTHNPQVAIQEYQKTTGLTPVVERIYTRTTIGVYRVIAIDDPNQSMRRPHSLQDEPI